MMEDILFAGHEKPSGTYSLAIIALVIFMSEV